MKQFCESRKIFAFFIAVVSAVLFSCDTSDEDYIPYVPVDFTVDLVVFNDLTTSGFSQKYDKPGFAGVIVFCELYDGSNTFNSVYHAYDAACTFEKDSTCSVTNQGNSFFATCPCCGTKYSLINGYPIEGKAEKPLKYYNVTLMNNKLYIKNK